MKKIVLALITVYQSFIPQILNQLLGTRRMCRYQITCSEYAKAAVKEHGVIKGGAYSIKRIVSCNPFNKNLGHEIGI